MKPFAPFLVATEAQYNAVCARAQSDLVIEIKNSMVPSFILFGGVQPMESILGIRLGHFR